MEPFEEAVRKGDAAAVRALLTKQPELRAAIDRPAFDTPLPSSSAGTIERWSIRTDFGGEAVQVVLRRHAAGSHE